MKLVNAQNRIQELMSRFVAQIEMAAAMSRTDLNKAAETILIPLLNEVYGWNLANINYTEDDNNYPGIDLVDEVARISIQVTATPSLEKVKHTLKQFIKRNQCLKYDRLIIYILKRKQDSYSETAIQGIIQNEFNFDSQKDIWDHCDILKEVSNFQIDRTLRVQGILEAYFGEDQRPPSFLATRSRQKIDWRETCRDLLSQWKGLTTNALMRRNGVRFQLDEIFVPLGVVERREKSKYRSNDGALAEQGSELYEEKITPISQNNFFEQVLRQRQSKHSQGKRIAIIGEPGAGKTTQLQKIGDWILEETDGIPIWIPLAEVGTRKLREYLLGDWLQTAIQELEVSVEHRDELGQLLKNEKVWLLLDGVDEMAISDALYQIATQMREGWLQNVRVVLTCRLNVWDGGKNALDGFDVYRNLDFEYPTEVHHLVDKWFATEPALQQKLKVALEQPGKERIRDMVKNPLRLTLLCYSWQLRQGELPETKAGLYEWFVDTFYEWNKGKVSIQLSAVKREELNRAIGELAKEAIDQENSRFRLRERLVNQFLGAADDEDSLFYLALRLGWLNRIGVAAENPLENAYAFFHPTFQEYFAALAIDDWKYFLNHITYGLEKRAYRIFRVEWKEVFLLWFCRCDLPLALKEQCVNSLMNFQDDCDKFFFYRAVFLAAEAVGEAKYYQKLDPILEYLMKWSTDALETTQLKLIHDHEYLEKGIFRVGGDWLGNYARKTLCNLKQIFECENNKLVTVARLFSCIASMMEDDFGRMVRLFKPEPDEIRHVEELANLNCAQLIDEICLEILEEESIFQETRRLDCLIECFNSNVLNDESEVVAAFIEKLYIHNHEDITKRIIWFLGRIQKKYNNLIECLESFVDPKYSLEIRNQAIWSILNTDPNNSVAIKGLSEIIRREPEYLDLSNVLDDLEDKKIGFQSSELENALTEIITSNREDELLWDITWTLAYVNPSNEEILKVLEFLLVSSIEYCEEAIPFYVRDFFGGQPKVIDILNRLIGTVNNKRILLRLAACLTLVDKINLNDGLNILAGLMEGDLDSEIAKDAAFYIGEFKVLNINAARALLNLQRSEDKEVRQLAANSLSISLPSLQGKYLAEIVKRLRTYTIELHSKYDFEYYQCCHEMLWHCAQSMSYPDFYQAWHNSSFEADAESFT